MSYDIKNRSLRNEEMGSDDLLRRDSSNSGKKTSFKFLDKNNKDKRGSRDHPQSSQTSSRRMRRLLHTIELIPPDYKVPSDSTLSDDYIEKEVKYVASIPNVPFAVDPTRRTDILRVLDNARHYGSADCSMSGGQDVILSFSAREITLLDRDTEVVIVREVIHNIAAVSYVRDSNRHLIFIKTANGEERGQNPEHCRLIVCACASRDKAEEACSIIQQIFNVVYTKLTLTYFEELLQSMIESNCATVSIPDHRFPSEERIPPESTNGEDRQSRSLKYLLKEYMETIKLHLTEAQLRQFGAILGAYKTNNDIKTFCNELHRLYGDQSERLIPGMRPYIPERDIAYFDHFLDAHNIQSIFWPSSRRTPSETSSSTIGPADFGPYSHSETDYSHDVDRNLLEHSQMVDQLERSVD